MEAADAQTERLLPELRQKALELRQGAEDQTLRLLSVQLVDVARRGDLAPA